MNFVTSWSGGKDSCYAMMQATQQGLIPKVLLNMMNENGKVSRSHGLPLSILNQQAPKIGLPLEGIIAVLKMVKAKYDLGAGVFGDIDLQPHKDWEDKVCAAASLKAILPLWQQDRIVLVHQMLENGIVTMIVSCNTIMGEQYLGKILTKELAQELHEKGIDPCAENGEFHTLVINCPLFSGAIELPEFTKITYENYCFIVWEE